MAADSPLKTVPEIIACKRDGLTLSEEDISHWVSLLVQGEVDDTQLGAWLMAVYVHGLTLEETSYLTRAMVESGVTLAWPQEWVGKLVDKHSTGGVGDKVSLPLAPALAACGLKVPMISGRGLGITGGTLDKLESIPGYRVQLTMEEIREMMEEVGCCIVGQTGQICPADKLMYAARDITSTVGSLGLITSSIISKKVAEGISSLVLDIKWGAGCYQETLQKAEEMAAALKQTSESLGVSTTAVISHMESPLGRAVGNSLEVAESLDCLRGKGPRDLRELVVLEGAMVLVSAKVVESLELGKQRIKEMLDNGKAMEKFQQMLVRQGVEPKIAAELCTADNNNILPMASMTTSLVCRVGGTVDRVEPDTMARLAIALGAGRSHPGDKLDLAAGVVLCVEPGDAVAEGDVWAVIHHNKEIPHHLLQRSEAALTVRQGNSFNILPRVTTIFLD
jgi:thymidine phosphorylase